jgi:gliding motility-associated-like protein
MKKIFSILPLLFSFYIQAQSTLLEAPKLTCVHNLTASNTDIELLWELPAVFTNFLQYEIYTAQSRSGPYTLTQTITNPAQNSTTINIVDNNVINYVYMQTRRTIGASAPLIAQSDTLDNNKNQKPVVTINYGTVQSDYSVKLSWEPSPFPEVIGYLIFNPNNANSPDTVFGRLNTTYIDNIANATSRPNTYQIRTFEYCENYPNPSGRNGDISEKLVTIFVKQPEVDKCTQEARIEWTKYEAPGVTVLKYGAFVARDLDLVFEKEFETDSLFGYVTNIPDEEIACIKIFAALSNGDTSYGNLQCVVGNVFTSPSNHSISNITVVNTQIVITYNIDTLADIRGYDLERSLDGINFTKLTSGVSRTGDDYTAYFTDFLPKINQEYYYYRVAAIDSCDSLHYSNVGASIFIDGDTKALTSILDWNKFKLLDTSYNYTINIYKIAKGDTTRIRTGNNLIQTFTDNNAFEIDTLYECCYFIEAIYTYKTPSDSIILDSSYSNTICLEPDEKIFVPNAFHPGGNVAKNRIFIPNFVFYTPKNYIFKVYDRWYRELFSTDNYKKGWDGTFEGNLSPSDSYIYVLQFIDDKGNAVSKKGTFVLIK